MKKLLIIAIMIFGATLFAQKPHTKILKITHKLSCKRNGFQLMLKNVTNDSRCPEGVTCVWAGEVTAVVSVYKNKKFIEDDSLVISSQHIKENKEWFLKYLGLKNISNIQIFPYPQNGITINEKEYCIKIEYLK